MFDDRRPDGNDFTGLLNAARHVMEKAGFDDNDAWAASLEEDSPRSRLWRYLRTLSDVLPKPDPRALIVVKNLQSAAAATGEDSLEGIDVIFNSLSDPLAEKRIALEFLEYEFVHLELMALIADIESL